MPETTKVGVPFTSIKEIGLHQSSTGSSTVKSKSWNSRTTYKSSDNREHLTSDESIEFSHLSKNVHLKFSSSSNVQQRREIESEKEQVPANFVLPSSNVNENQKAIVLTHQTEITGSMIMEHSSSKSPDKVQSLDLVKKSCHQASAGISSLSIAAPNTSAAVNKSDDDKPKNSVVNQTSAQQQIPQLSHTWKNNNASTQSSQVSQIKAHVSTTSNPTTEIDSTGKPDIDIKQFQPLSNAKEDLSQKALQNESQTSNQSGITQSLQGQKSYSVPLHKIAHPTTQPVKATTFSHLSTKYSKELEYMLVEFRKLERQLLGGHAGLKNGVEGQVSRERREKLHSFIVHLEETSKQIQAGCHKYNEKQTKPTEHAPPSSEDDKEKKRQEEEDVKLLEEHILSNLLPVKTRLVKQLSAQGRLNSTRGGKSMSACSHQSSHTVQIPRGYPQPKNHGQMAFLANNLVNGSSSTTYTVGSLPQPQVPLRNLENVESQYGRQLGGETGSSLTKKLHGQTLGSTEENMTSETSSNTKAESKVSTSPPITVSDHQTMVPGISTQSNIKFDEVSLDPQQPKRQILYAGLAPGSDMKSKMASVAAAAGTDETIANIYDNFDVDSFDTQSCSDATTSFSDLAPLTKADAIPLVPNTAHLCDTSGEKNTVPAEAQHPIHQNQPKEVIQILKTPNPIPTTQQTQCEGNSMVYVPPKQNIPSEVTSSISPPSNMSQKNQPINNLVGPSNTTRGPASVAADAVVSSITQSNVTHKASDLRSQMPPPPPLNPLTLSKNSCQDKKKESAALERRKRRIEKRRRRRKRRQARLFTITEVYLANNRRMLNPHQNGNSILSDLHTGSDSRENDRYKSVLHAGTHGIKMVGGNMLNGGHFSKVRNVEYICSHCNEQYGGTCEYNPWWAMTREDCPKCGNSQVPRIDINAPTNAIEYHPALLAHAEDGCNNGTNSGNGGSSTNTNTNTGGVIDRSFTYISSNHHASDQPPMLQTNNKQENAHFKNDSDSEPHPSDEEGFDDDAESSDESTVENPLDEDFGRFYSGPHLSDQEAAKLLIFMEHASTCPGRHKSLALSQFCNSIKYLMLHVRDCPGITITSGDVCPFPWCRKVKHLLYHLVSCTETNKCKICRPTNISHNLKNLVKLNQARRKKQKLRNNSNIIDERNNPPKNNVVPNTSTMQVHIPKPPLTSAPTFKYDKNVNYARVVTAESVNVINKQSDQITKPALKRNERYIPQTNQISTKNSQPQSNLAKYDSAQINPPSSMSQNKEYQPDPVLSSQTIDVCSFTQLKYSYTASRQPWQNICQNITNVHHRPMNHFNAAQSTSRDPTLHSGQILHRSGKSATKTCHSEPQNKCTPQKPQEAVVCNSESNAKEVKADTMNKNSSNFIKQDNNFNSSNITYVSPKSCVQNIAHQIGTKRPAPSSPRADLSMKQGNLKPANNMEITTSNDFSSCPSNYEKKSDISAKDVLNVPNPSQNTHGMTNSAIQPLTYLQSSAKKQKLENHDNKNINFDLKNGHTSTEPVVNGQDEIHISNSKPPITVPIPNEIISSNPLNKSDFETSTSSAQNTVENERTKNNPTNISEPNHDTSSSSYESEVSKNPTMMSTYASVPDSELSSSPSLPLAPHPNNAGNTGTGCTNTPSEKRSERIFPCAILP